jgi:hypothetical protein
MSTRKRISDPTGIPEGEHYAIIEFSRITIPGDERSRTHPGHGYPESTEDVQNYIVFTDRKEWEAEIEKRTAEQRLYSSSRQFVPIIAKRPKVETSVKVSIG